MPVPALSRIRLTGEHDDPLAIIPVVGHRDPVHGDWLAWRLHCLPERLAQFFAALACYQIYYRTVTMFGHALYLRIPARPGTLASDVTVM
jgi:hypothetical protein